VDAQVIEGLTGVWTAGHPPLEAGSLGPQGTPVGGNGAAGGESRKIGAIGVHVNRGITTHGFAINVNNDLQPFEWIVPCGIEACRVTSLCRELGAEQDMDAFMDTVRDRFGEVYGREPVEVEAAEVIGPAAAVR
jgi:lipoyl(octanoyl) transferase